MSTRWERWKLKRAEYPSNWRDLVKLVRERAQYRCQMCEARHAWFHPITGTVVYLQTAHLDGDHTSADLNNLAALCPRCHIIYDARRSAQSAYITRRAGRALGDLFA